LLRPPHGIGESAIVGFGSKLKGPGFKNTSKPRYAPQVEPFRGDLSVASQQERKGVRGLNSEPWKGEIAKTDI